jgi:hypothetical protein
MESTNGIIRWNQQKHKDRAITRRWKPPMEATNGYHQSMDTPDGAMPNEATDGRTAVRMTTTTTTQRWQPKAATDGSNQRRQLMAAANNGSNNQGRMTMMGITETMIPPVTRTLDRKTS